jgi:hypothetical protein
VTRKLNHKKGLKKPSKVGAIDEVDRKTADNPSAREAPFES